MRCPAAVNQAAQLRRDFHDLIDTDSPFEARIMALAATCTLSEWPTDFVGQADFIPGVVEQGTVLTELGIFPHEKEYSLGAKVVVMIRPDDVHVAPSDQAKATILARQFRGSENLYTIALPSGRIVHSSASSTSIHPVGTPVELRVIATHTVLFPQDDDLAQP